MMQFLVESVVLSLVGGIIGVLLGEGIYALAVAIVSALLEEIPFVFNPMAIIISLSVCTAVGLFFGWYPARKPPTSTPSKPSATSRGLPPVPMTTRKRGRVWGVCMACAIGVYFF